MQGQFHPYVLEHKPSSRLTAGGGARGPRVTAVDRMSAQLLRAAAERDAGRPLGSAASARGGGA
ncbi:hypothetical protein [Paenibacillus contaminans]|uniref:hypothetical protein n=1 Tax=Paenibacillus contaminans TaxID=450362 RepID=UPI0011BF8342|nr:hypothetical protein [Paenibacillus contaminans]